VANWVLECCVWIGSGWGLVPIELVPLRRDDHLTPADIEFLEEWMGSDLDRNTPDSG
jgi:hypothetical protein